MREQANYQDALNQILKANNGKHYVRLKRASEILGLNKDTIKANFDCEQIGRCWYISAERLARRLG